MCVLFGDSPVVQFNFGAFVVGDFCLSFDRSWSFLVVDQLSVLVLCVDERCKYTKIGRKKRGEPRETDQ